MMVPQKISALQLASEKYERREYASAIELLEPLAKLGDVKAKSYLTEIYWRVEGYKDLRRAALLQKELNDNYESNTMAYELGIFREALMLLEASDDPNNGRLNSLFMSLKNSRNDRNLVLAASMAKSDRIIEQNRDNPLALYMKAFARASRLDQKIRILGLLVFEIFSPSKNAVVVYPRPRK
ncbi:hypothetical protein [Metallibacterium scheffleri]|uniref:hypothetical protein n=1 Tax=Metallibacterium scheffleri TaxID=993689 RepID=UPI00109F60DA|nr:hypothetical protein [Metallibacterium scheffleri]